MPFDGSSPWGYAAFGFFILGIALMMISGTIKNEKQAAIVGFISSIFWMLCSISLLIMEWQLIPIIIPAVVGIGVFIQNKSRYPG